jgi:hypothetical protein
MAPPELLGGKLGRNSMAMTFEELEAQVGKGTLGPEVEKFINESIIHRIFQMKFKDLEFWSRPDAHFSAEPFNLIATRTLRAQLASNPESVPLNFKQSAVSVEDYERLSARHTMFLSLLGGEAIEKRLTGLFPDALTECRFTLRCTPEEHAGGVRGIIFNN